ncbi:lipopolysaccharide biosynthesis protein [Kosakonia oryzae]|uniref:Lipopolysaccharide biosynthesis protein n=1 Tax=Kosakonia oryzae TaxID=497725 RepID=A0AA94H518_9ENTR|nr:lipopolysaccharide biosynthesis protein [Kosakonia oryzae]ANI82283.1 lipopolysaccharide biosynthesis protein [Kosakonia oryzae]SFC53291.1 polysaccharide transporter, PST family [Kosakonia oryzae]
MNLFNNAKWVAFSQLFKILVQLVNLVYIARLISPDEYGIMAMALVVVNFGSLIRDLGTAAAIIQRKEISDDLINAVFWLNIFMGISIAFVIVLFTPLIAMFFHQQKLSAVLLLISLIFPLSSSAAAHLALLERESKFQKIAIIEITSSLASVVIALLMAYYGFGVFSLVAQALVLNLLSAIQLWFGSTWRPNIKKAFHFSELRKIFGFSANLSLFNFINYFTRNSDNMIIGRYMSEYILGAYSLAYRVMLFPLQSLTFIAGRSLFPILSKYQDDNVKIRKTYLDCVFIILLIVVPLMSGMAVLRESFVAIVFGKQWHLTSEILLWLAPTAIVQSVLSTSGTVFMAKARTDMLMTLGILSMILQVSAFIIGVQYDIITFAKLYFIANVINFIPAMHFLMKIIGGNLWDLFKKSYCIFISNALMILVLVLIRNISVTNIEVLSLVISIVGGIASFSVSIILLSSDIRRWVKSRIKND